MNRYVVYFCAAAILVSACGSQPKEPEKAAPTPAAGAPAPIQNVAPAPPATYKFTGKVVTIDKEGKRIVAANDDIPGFMSAMTMEYSVKDEHQLDNLKPGEAITAKLTSSGGGQYLLEDIAPAK